MKIFILISLILLISSCRLFEAEDTTDPIVNITIEGGNEISREITLYLDIEDDSKIDSVQVVIDDSTYATFYSNFDTISFTVNEFEFYESEELEISELAKSTKSFANNEIDEIQYLYVIAYDKEGNIGESSKQEVVITEFPGWRKYYKSDWGPYAFLVDENSRVWMGYGDDCMVYDPEVNSIRELLIPQTNDFLYDKIINDFALVEGSRVWMATDHRIVEYIYDIDKWLQFAVPPADTSWDGTYYHAYIWSIAVDSYYNVYVGTEGGRISKYNGADFQHFGKVGGDVFSINVHPDGTIYYFCEGTQQSYIKDDIIYEYDNYPDAYISGIYTVIDADGNVWIEYGLQHDGCYLYDGSSWIHLQTGSNTTEYIYPILGAKDGIVYAQIHGLQWENQHKRVSGSLGIATYDGNSWLYWKDLDTPFKAYQADNIPSVINFNSIIDEAPNGDIWMVLDNILWRYRPSLGGYP